MQSPKKGTNFLCPSNFPAVSGSGIFFSCTRVPTTILGQSSIGSGISFVSPRCQEKGCVFPSTSPSSLHCRYHEHQQAEPILFHSQQPSWALLDQARFSLPDMEPELVARHRDRRRLAELWERFQSDEPV
jgi:hypothetical protein